ncbi:MAG: hypothetical protein EBR82_31130 [Caulobacteraceae bacterium]|nr:hypothetical protein [Caulobacteraceae bacterium]
MARTLPPSPDFVDFPTFGNWFILNYPQEDIPPTPPFYDSDDLGVSNWQDWFADILNRPSFIDFHFPNPYNYSRWQDYARSFTYALLQQP